MRKLLLICGSLFLVCSCGSLKINPKNCKTEAVWGSPDPKEAVIEVKSRSSYYVFGDQEVKLSDILAENAIECEAVKSVRVVVSTSWLFVRDMSLKVVKK
jgi:hypothetical protein